MTILIAFQETLELFLNKSYIKAW